MALCSLAVVLAWSGAARGQAWISFVEDPTRISADISVIEDLPCNSNCTGTCGPVTGVHCSNKCACACEKDMAVGDLDGDGDDDLVIVRIQPFYTGGGVSNLLFLNENGIMVDRSDLVEGFADLTQDRDVVIVDVDAIVGSNLNMPDVVTATTLGEQPRVYMNLGCCSTPCSPSSPCVPGNQIACDDPSNPTWCGLKYDSSENRLPTFSPGPNFCGVAAGDLNDDKCRDLYFTDYENTLEDRLLFNGKDPQTGACTGFFTDVTTSPATRLCPNGPPCFYEVLFGTGVRIVDIDLDGFNDIVKVDAIDDSLLTDDGELIILYNDDANPGYFNVKHLPQEEPGFGTIDTPYMFAAGDMNNDGGVDLYVLRTKNAVADRFIINKCFQGDPLPAECDRGDGTVQFDLPTSVTETGRTNYPGGNVALIDLDGDSFRDVVRADVDVPGSFCTNTMRLLQTTVDPLDPMNVTLKEPIGPPGPTINGGNCAWNTNITYDFAVFDIDGDTRPDLWSGHAGGNQVFMAEVPSDCDGNGVPDRCITTGGSTPGTEVPEEACCLVVGSHRLCVDTFQSCCDAAGGLFQTWLDVLPRTVPRDAVTVHGPVEEQVISNQWSAFPGKPVLPIPQPDEASQHAGR